MRIGFFGAGNMASAIAEGIHKGSPDIEMFFYTPSHFRAKDLALKVNGNYIDDLDLMPKNLDWYFLCFKPQSLNDFNFVFSSHTKVISILAGISISKLKNKFELDKVVRVMPNTPSSLGFGANIIYADEKLSLSEYETIKKLLNFCGKVFKVKSEEELNILTPFSGSGPGLIFEMARIFEAELIKRLPDIENSKEIIAQTFLGSSMLMSHEDSFLGLRDKVTSKKGVTFEALETLRESNLEEIISKAIDRAIKRNNELNG